MVSLLYLSSLSDLDLITQKQVKNICEFSKKCLSAYFQQIRLFCPQNCMRIFFANVFFGRNIWRICEKSLLLYP